MSKRAWMMCRSFDVNQSGTSSSADLGGSSNYSNENFEGRVSKGSVVTAIGHGLFDPKT